MTKQITTVGIAAAIVLLLVTFTRAQAQHYVPAEKGSRMEFTFQHGTGADIRKVKGSFGTLIGLIQFDPKSLPKSAFDVSVTTASLQSDQANGYRLRSSEFFDVSKFPTIKLKSNSITQDKPGGIVYSLSGNLTIKGVTKPVKITFTALPNSTGYVFRGVLQFSREAYGVGERGEFDDNVTVFLQIVMKKK